MHRHFDDDIIHVKDLLVRMAAKTEYAVGASIRALEERDPVLAQDVIEHDTDIDQLELEIDQQAIELIAKMQPAASDLRFIGTIMKVTPDIERIADLAQDVCERVVELAAEPPLHRHDIMPLGRAAQRMVHDAFDALIHRDAELARRVIDADDEVDRLTEISFREHLTYMLEDARSITRATRMTFIGKYFERMADGATNICEMVVYLVEGKVIKHASGSKG